MSSNFPSLNYQLKYQETIEKKKSNDLGFNHEMV